MNPLERALYVQLTRLLVAQRTPSGRPMTEREWWLTLEVAETLGTGPASTFRARGAGNPHLASRPGS